MLGWWLVFRVKWALKADISVLNPHFLLITILRILLVEVIDNALLDGHVVHSALSCGLLGIYLDVNF